MKQLREESIAQVQHVLAEVLQEADGAFADRAETLVAIAEHFSRVDHGRAAALDPSAPSGKAVVQRGVAPLVRSLRGGAGGGAAGNPAADAGPGKARAMNRESLFYIPCLCGREVRSHERETQCPACGRWLIVEWGWPAEVRQEESRRAYDAR